MKIAVTGKGGVGKTTLSALLARTAHSRGNRVVAIDADPDSNLAATLGCPDPDAIVPLTQRKALIEERVGTGGILRLNPKVDDLIGSYGVDVGGITVVVLGSIPKGGSGCFCPPNALLKAFLNHVFLKPDEWVIVDMEAGLEHLGRGSSAAVDLLAVVVEPSERSIETAQRIGRLGADLGVRRIGCVANKVETEEQARRIRDGLTGIPLLGVLPWTDALRGFTPEVNPRAAGANVEESMEQIYAIVTQTQWPAAAAPSSALGATKLPALEKGESA